MNHLKHVSKHILFMVCMVCIMGACMAIATPKTAKAASKAGKVGLVNSAELNLRSKASMDGKVKVKLTAGDRVIIKKKSGDWLKVKAFHKSKSYKGYVYGSYIDLCRSGKVYNLKSGDKLKLRKKTSTNSKILAKLKAGKKVYILKELNGWYKVDVVINKKHKVGYVSAQYIKVKSAKSNGRVIYLTFDDGPYKYTDKLLKILKKYDVKATFFVTNQYPDYRSMIKKEAKAGHTVAVHTYSHDYAKIYKSRRAYLDDLDKMAAIIKKQTGKYPHILRFPGGSSNTVSRNYCRGIMSDLTSYVGDYGYVYSDWNVTSGDAGETTSTEQVYKNVINGIKNQGSKPSVVLQHDIKGFSVDAVERIIKWGLDNGYTFKKMTKKNGIVHHGVNN